MHVGSLDHFDGLAVQRSGSGAAEQPQPADIAVGVEVELDDVGSLLSETARLSGVAQVVEGLLGDLEDPAQVFVDKSALGGAHSGVAAAVEPFDEPAGGAGGGVPGGRAPAGMPGRGGSAPAGRRHFAAGFPGDLSGGFSDGFFPLLPLVFLHGFDHDLFVLFPFLFLPAQVAVCRE